MGEQVAHQHGREAPELEGALRERLGVKDVCLFTNGHSALECAIEALGLGLDGRDEVVTTPFTFASTTHAIVRKGSSLCSPTSDPPTSRSIPT